MSDIDTTVFGEDTKVVVLAGGQPGPSGSPGPPLIPRGMIDTYGDLPPTEVYGALYVAADTYLYWAWNGSAWVSLGPSRGAPADPQDIVDAVEAEVATLATLDDGTGTRVRLDGGLARVDRAVLRPVSTFPGPANTAAETSVLAVAPVLPAGLLLTEKVVVRGSVALAVTNNSGADRTLTVRVRLGGSTLFTWTTTALTTSATARMVRASFEFTTATIFVLQGTGMGSLSVSAPGSVGADSFSQTVGVSISPAIDFSTALALDVRVQMSAAHASFTVLPGVQSFELSRSA